MNDTQNLAAMLGEADYLILMLRQRCAALNVEVQKRDAEINELTQQVAAMQPDTTEETDQ